MAKIQDLLVKHRPLLAYDPQEELRALPVESLVDVSGNVLVRREGAILAEADGGGNRRLSLNLLQQMVDDSTARSGDQVHLASSARACLSIQDPARFPSVAYGRAVRDGSHLWLQYWLWFYGRSFSAFERGQHQGGWELLQIGLDPQSFEPRVVTAKCRPHPISARWEEIARARCQRRCGRADCSHPVARIALFKHAIHLEVTQGDTHTHFANMSEQVLPEVREFGEWNRWPGRWGASGPFFAISLSPRGPAHQRNGWRSPERYHRKARSFKGSLHRATPHRRSPAPLIQEMWIEGESVRVIIKTEKRYLRPRRWLYVTVHEPDHLRVIRPRLARVGTNGHSDLRIPLSDDRTPDTPVLVRVSSVGRLPIWSSVAASWPAMRGAPAANRGQTDSLSPRVLKRFHHALIRHLDRRGAMSTAELGENPPTVLDLPLSASEVEGLVESARRHGLVSVEQRGGGSETPEWTLTDRGRKRVSGPRQLGLGALKALPLALIVPVVTQLTKDVHGFLGWAVVASVTAITLGLLVLVVLSIHRYSQGALARRVALEWDRHAVELPALNRWYRRPGRVALYVLAGLLLLTVLALSLWQATQPGGTALGFAFVAVAYAITLLVTADLTRVGVLRYEASKH